MAAQAAPAGPLAADAALAPGTARAWAGATELSLMAWAFALLELPADFANHGLGICVIALFWMLVMVQGYTVRIGEVIGPETAEAG